jgi:hypothetical protein
MSRPSPVYNAATLANIRAMRDEGKPLDEIAHKIGTTKGSLTARCSQLGISTRKPRKIAA